MGHIHKPATFEILEVFNEAFGIGINTEIGDRIDAILRARFPESAPAERGEERWYPDIDPITGAPHFMDIEHPTHGGPFDSFTLSERDIDDSTPDTIHFTRERFDHDEGCWVDCIEQLGIVAITQNRLLELEEARDTLAARSQPKEPQAEHTAGPVDASPFTSDGNIPPQAEASGEQLEDLRRALVGIAESIHNAHSTGRYSLCCESNSDTALRLVARIDTILASHPAPTDEKAQWVRCPVCGEEYAVDALMAPTKHTTDEKVLKALGDLRKEQA